MTLPFLSMENRNAIVVGELFAHCLVKLTFMESGDIADALKVFENYFDPSDEPDLQKAHALICEAIRLYRGEAVRYEQKRVS